MNKKNIIVGNAAGAFSSILKYISWMEIEEHNNCSVYFHFENKTINSGNCFINYSYQKYHKNMINVNIFDQFFKYEEKNCSLHSSAFNQNDIYVECYPYMVNLNLMHSKTLRYNGQGMSIDQYKNDISDIRQAFNKHWSKFKLSDRLEEKYRSQKYVEEKKTLCVMLRCSAHYNGTFNFESIIHDIKQSMDKNYCEKLYILTQIDPFLQLIIKYFGKEKCYYPERERNTTDSDWSGGKNIYMPDKKFISETEESIIDVLNASNCSHIISGASNMFLGALCFNPNIKYSIYNTLHDRNGA
jgi:hypothetical protein